MPGAGGVGDQHGSRLIAAAAVTPVAQPTRQRNTGNHSVAEPTSHGIPGARQTEPGPGAPGTCPGLPPIHCPLCPIYTFLVSDLDRLFCHA